MFIYLVKWNYSLYKLVVCYCIRKINVSFCSLKNTFVLTLCNYKSTLIKYKIKNLLIIKKKFNGGHFEILKAKFWKCNNYVKYVCTKFLKDIFNCYRDKLFCKNHKMAAFQKVKRFQTYVHWNFSYFYLRKNHPKYFWNTCVSICMSMLCIN